MDSAGAALELLADVKARLADSVSAACDHDDKAAKASAKAALEESVWALLRLISQAPKEDLPASVRSELDMALLEDAVALKWPLLKGLKYCALYRAYLGLPNTMEQTRKHLTLVSASKCSEILGKGGLGADLTACQDAQELRWVNDVLVFMSGAGRFKKDLGGFELKGPSMNSCRQATNQAKKQLQLLEQGEISKVQNKGDEERKTRLGVGAVYIERDYRLDDAKRAAANAAEMETIFDQAIQLKFSKHNDSNDKKQNFGKKI